jgi:hypothetical protein
MIDGIRGLSGEKIQWYLAAELRDRIRQTGVRSGRPALSRGTPSPSSRILERMVELSLRTEEQPSSAGTSSRGITS